MPDFSRPDFALEDRLIAQGHGLVAGVDEVGRGPWAGPVVAAAVILDRSTPIAGLDDSKRLTAKRRERLFHQLIAQDGTHIGIGQASVAEIDSMNILQASLLAMRRAICALPHMPDAALVDGNKAPSVDCPVTCVVKGDSISCSIAAASIVAKVTRDRMMERLALRHPGYGWERNAGYGTAQHREGLRTLGVTDHHRRSFAPIAKILGG